MTARRTAVTTGRLLQLIALGHTAVGVAVYRRELRAIGRRKVVGTVGYRGPEATAFWFLVPSPLVWMVGDLLHRAERADDREAQRSANGVGLALAAIAVACMPVSGFWGLLAVSVRGLRRAGALRR